MNDSYSNSCNTHPITKQLQNLWTQNPYITSKKACNLLGLDYKKHGNYLNSLLSKLRSNPHIGLAQKPQNIHKRVFVWDNVPRNLLPEKVSPDFFEWKGWRRSNNNNGMLVFRYELGVVHWYKGGKVRLFLKGDLKLSSVKELFCRAFGWLDIKEINKFIDAPLREESKHIVFDVKDSVPPFNINYFKNSHGIRIFSDNSHPEAVEVEETVPFWVSRILTEFERLSEIVSKNNHITMIENIGE